MATTVQTHPLRRNAMNQQGAMYDFLWNVKELLNTVFPNAGLTLERSSAPSSPSSVVLSGLTGNTASLRTYQATVTVANGQTAGKETSIGMPADFLPLCVLVHVTVAATNAVTLVDIGDDADTDTYCDGLTTASLATTGFKGVFGCNGTRGIPSADTGAIGATRTADEVEVVVSGDPGATGVTLRLTFIGFVTT